MSDYKIGQLDGEISGIKNDVKNLRDTQKDIFKEIKNNHTEVLAAVQNSHCKNEDKLQYMEDAIEVNAVGVDENATALTPLVEEHKANKEKSGDYRRAVLEAIGAIVVAIIVWALLG